MSHAASILKEDDGLVECQNLFFSRNTRYHSLHLDIQFVISLFKMVIAVADAAVVALLAVAAKVDPFEKQTLKPGYHIFQGSRVETRRFQAYTGS